MNYWRKLLLATLFLLSQQWLCAQYILNGSAQQNSCNCYTLTQPVEFQSGSVWNSNKINLNNSFDFWFNVFLGCNDAGADGIVFILQPISTSVGTAGGGMGFEGVVPSVGIALDTYRNPDLGDPVFDHISLQANGIVNHGNDLAGPVPASTVSDNIEDCRWHKLRITWDAGTKWLRTYFDGVLRLEKQVDLVTTIFNNDPNVYWGFTGATGGEENLQQFCTALDPIFSSGFTNNIACIGTPIVFSNTSESFAPISSYHWDFGDGTFSTEQNPPPHLYASPGQYQVKLKVTGQDGCERDSVKTITIAPNPDAELVAFDTCEGFVPRFSFTPPNAGINYEWKIDGAFAGRNPTPSLPDLLPGSHQLQLIIASNYGCGVPDTVDASFLVKARPSIDALVTDGCVDELLEWEGRQVDAATSISQWNWSFDDRLHSSRDVQYTFNRQSDYLVKLWAVADNGCASDTIEKNVTISRALITARDTTIIKNTPAQLLVTGNGDFSWSPATGLSSTSISNPVAILDADQSYTITVTTPEGCTSEKTISVKVFEGPSVYVPTAFTPNNDGKNEILLPVYVGIKELKQFAVFNRWGQQVFSTTNMGKGWEGKSPAGTYVWIVSIVTQSGQPMIFKGTTTIIK